MGRTVSSPVFSDEGQHVDMSNLSFVASLVGSLAVPVTVLAVLVLFRRPLVELLGRIVSYEGLGQKVSFGRKLANAENTVSRATADVQDVAVRAQINATSGSRQMVHGQSPSVATSKNEGIREIDLEKSGFLGLAAVATANPSFVVIKGWEDLRTELQALVRAEFPDAKVRNPLDMLPKLEKDKYVNHSFVSGVMELFDLRNNVAHGLHNPTPGEAVAYLNSAERLMMFSAVARGQADARREFEEIRTQDRSNQRQE